MIGFFFGLGALVGGAGSFIMGGSILLRVFARGPFLEAALFTGALPTELLMGLYLILWDDLGAKGDRDWYVGVGVAGRLDMRALMLAGVADFAAHHG